MAEPDTLVRVGHVIAGLKDVALTTGAGGQIHLANLLGPSLVQYECDTAIILNPTPDGPQRVVWSIEKNRSGQANVEMVYNLLGMYFCFNPMAVEVNLQAE